MAAAERDHQPGATADPVGDVTGPAGGAPGAAAAARQPQQPGERYSHLVSSGAGADRGAQRAAPDFLVLVIDCNPFGWASAAAAAAGGEANGGAEASAHVATAALEKTLRDVLIFLNAHLALQHDNGVAVYAAAGERAQLLFSTASKASIVGNDEDADEETNRPDANSFQHFRSLDERVFKGVRVLLKTAAAEMQAALEQTDDMEVEGEPRQNGHAGTKGQQLGSTGIVSALAQALCHIHRLNLSALAGGSMDGAGGASIARPADAGSSAAAQSAAAAAGHAFRSRILILSVTPDASSQYVAMMNCIFGAQKSLIPINVYKMHGEDSVFLQQASHLTKGNYLRADSKQQQGLLQVLLTAFLPSRSIAGLVHLPNQDEVDFRAACFCHRKIVDVGYVCSVCLSIFCEPIPSCIICKSRFPRKSLERFTSDHKLLEILGIAR